MNWLNCFAFGEDVKSAKVKRCYPGDLETCNVDLEELLPLLRQTRENLAWLRVIIERRLERETKSSLLPVDHDKAARAFGALLPIHVGVTLDAWELIDYSLPEYGSRDTRLDCVLMEAAVAIKKAIDREKGAGDPPTTRIEFEVGLILKPSDKFLERLPQVRFSAEIVNPGAFAVLKIDTVHKGAE